MMLRCPAVIAGGGGPAPRLRLPPGYFKTREIETSPSATHWRLKGPSLWLRSSASPPVPPDHAPRLKLNKNELSGFEISPPEAPQVPNIAEVCR